MSEPRLGWERIGPGIYVDPEERLHLFVSEALKGFGYQDTPANRKTLMAAMREIVHEKYGAIPIEEIE